MKKIIAKTTKFTTSKKATKKSYAKKTINRENKITRILSKVSEICDYAIENLCTEDAQFEELELMLRQYIK